MLIFEDSECNELWILYYENLVLWLIGGEFKLDGEYWMFIVEVINIVIIFLKLEGIELMFVKMVIEIELID